MKRLLPVALLFFWLISPTSAAPPAKIYVLLWFDTEDYVLPASDDAALKVASWLEKEEIRATFKVVGEKARTLERRGRTDVIEALKKHEIGYHSNYHSTQPSPAMYLSNLGWDEGVAEFERREGPGFNDVKRVLGQAPTCYGQPGSSWGPQSFGAMKKWGMGVYLDAGRHVSLDGRPHYYCGLLTLYHLTYSLRTNLGGPNDLKQAEDRFIEARQKLLAEGGGVVSIYYHPCEFVHKQFWDAVNFAKGANPPREEWKLPPQKTEEESRIAYETFEGYIRFIKRFPEVEFVTATNLAIYYRDLAQRHKFLASEIRAIAAGVGDEVGFQRHDEYTMSASEVFALLNAAFVWRNSGRGDGTGLELVATPLGPTGAPPAITDAVTTDANQFARAASDVQEYLAHHGRVPSIVWLGSKAVTPEAYFAALARLVQLQIDNKPLPEKIELNPAKLAAGKYVSDDDPRLWGWVIFPPGFRAPAMMDLARRQAWTIKPAINHGLTEKSP
jgi:hypothetical protein